MPLPVVLQQRRRHGRLHKSTGCETLPFLAHPLPFHQGLMPLLVVLQDFLRPRIKAIVTLQQQWGAVHDM